jgi:uncharacterized membrane protein
MPNPYVLFLAMTIIFFDAGTYNSQTIIQTPEGSFLPSFTIICSVVSEEKIFEED